MPIYTYITVDKTKGCKHCQNSFEWLHKTFSETKLVKCPKCSSPIKKILSGFSLGASKTNFDRRAKEQGFHKLKKVDKGKYEKLY